MSYEAILAAGPNSPGPVLSEYGRQVVRRKARHMPEEAQPTVRNQATDLRHWPPQAP